MKYTKHLLFLLIAILALGLLAGCGTSEPAADIQIRVGALRGPSGIGMAPLMAWAEDGQTEIDYSFTLGGAPEEMTAGLISGELDIAALPVNMASVLYNRDDGEVTVISALTQSVLFVLDATGEIHDVTDLRGRTIHITGQGAMPQFGFEHILRRNGLEPGVDVDIVFNAEHSELAALMTAGEVSIGLLPQPFVTAVLGQNDDVQIALDLAAEWTAVDPDTAFVQSSMAVRTAFLEEHPAAVEQFLLDHAASLAFVSANVDEAAELVERFDIVPAPVARQVIPRSNFVYITGAEMQPIVLGFLTVIYEANPNAVGGRVPDADFFFLG